jgi:hypothetical protein
MNFESTRTLKRQWYISSHAPGILLVRLRKIDIANIHARFQPGPSHMDQLEQQPGEKRNIKFDRIAGELLTLLTAFKSS